MRMANTIRCLTGLVAKSPTYVMTPLNGEIVYYITEYGTGNKISGEITLNCVVDGPDFCGYLVNDKYMLPVGIAASLLKGYVYVESDYVTEEEEE